MLSITSLISLVPVCIMSDSQGKTYVCRGKLPYLWNLYISLYSSLSRNSATAFRHARETEWEMCVVLKLTH